MARIVIVVLMLLASGPLPAREIIVTSVGAPTADVAKLRAEIEPAFASTAARTGLHDEGRLELTLVGDPDTFAQIAGAAGVSLRAESVLGFALPSQRTVVLNLAAIRKGRLSARGVLHHEICHLVLGANLTAARPTWFEEGVCQWVEPVSLATLIESSPGAAIEPDYESLSDLDRALREDARAGFAYREAKSVIALLVVRYGKEALRLLLRELSAGILFEDAFKKATDVNLAAFEALWLQDRADRRTSRFFAWLGANWFWLLFGSAGIFGAIAMFKRRGRDRARIAQWEETEKAFPSDPEWSYYEDE